MRISLIISFSMHTAVMAAAFLVLPEAKIFEVKNTETVFAETITESQFSKLTAKKEEKKEEEKPKPKPEPEKKVEPKKEKIKKAPPPPPPPPEPEVEVPPPPKPPEPKPSEPEPPEPKVEAPPEPKPPELEKKKVEAKPKVVPIPRSRPKPAQIKPKKKSKFDQKVAALLDKLPEDRTETAQSAPEKSESQFSGRDATVSASDKDLMRQKIGRCWSPPVGVKDAEKLIVKIKIRLKRDGTLSRPPQIMSSSSEIAADSALRAIRRCVPYDMFPAKKYNTWREIVLNFDPRTMFGG